MTHLKFIIVARYKRNRALFKWHFWKDFDIDGMSKMHGYDHLNCLSCILLQLILVKI
jgi:hypothetical protein